LKESIDLDRTLCVELNILLQCLWELVSRCHGRGFWYLLIALLQSAVNKFICFKQDVRFMICIIGNPNQRHQLIAIYFLNFHTGMLLAVKD
jgi:hypothetical protein